MNKYSREQQQVRSGRIPAFGNWDQVKELPITQYFENARQAGLLNTTTASAATHSRQLSYAASHNKIYHPPHLPYNKEKNTAIKSYSHEKKAGKYCDTSMHRQNHLQTKNISSGVVSASHPKLLPTIKPVDEDLYEIPPEILRNSKRKKFFGFFSKCFVPHTI